MFDDFDWKNLLKSVDALIRKEKYGSYQEITSLTIRELDDIWKVITSKEQEANLQEALQNVEQQQWETEKL